MEEEKLRAVLDEDISSVLEKFGQVQAVVDGEIICQECGIPITLKNIQVIIPLREGKFHYVCNRVECVIAYLEKQKDV
ncbi:MAG: hypothetical protein NTY36_02930 [Deltaproteobacteria bacterium]|nr:hypothetical protein [Deltaproteobacteria bacterium]